MKNKLAIHELNRLSETEFVFRFEDLFNTALCIPVISGAAGMRPFSDALDCLNCILAQFDRTDFSDMLEIMRNYGIPGGGLSNAPTAFSKIEQRGAGLGQYQRSACDVSRLDGLFQAHRAKFSFNFVLSVKRRSNEQVMASLEKRIANDFETEFLANIMQIKRIAFVRLIEIIEFTDDERERCCFKYPDEYERYIQGKRKEFESEFGPQAQQGEED
uniref:2-oxo-4-hydroxy-4-carboxy-5-ureidoimidazoline decarboxylase n=1 Tax=Candidatus Kentrum sp. FW TaxID=2126338 RepID=A0A450TSW0_9GAMM|nr:MAG: 2-oxo-4-hydroxy-4-carboxy--5-ureidoimidazoline (OHCU) decarboxylase [Candidatus Kentron sp. FW]